MLTLWAMSLPGLVVILFGLAIVDQIALKLGRTKWIPWRGTGRRGQVSSTGFAQLHAALDPGKQHDIETRRNMSLLREDEAEGAPPGDGVDLAAGTAVIHGPASGR